MAKAVLLVFGLFVFLGGLFTSQVDGQSQEPVGILPDARQYIYPSVDRGVMAAVVNPCGSIDAQYPDRPCSPPQQQMTPPPYLPLPYRNEPPPPMDYNRYPYAYDKQLDDRTFPTLAEDDVPSQYV